MAFRVLLVYVMNVITSSKGVNKMGKRGMLNLVVNFIVVIAIMVSVLAFDKDSQRYFAKTTYDIDTSDPTAAVAEILKDKTAYARGAKIVGTMPNNGAKNYTISNLND